MKYIYIIIFLISINQLQAIHPEWRLVDSIPQIPTRSSYRDIKCADSNNCIALVTRGSYWIRRTTDGGETWENISIPNLVDITYPSVNLMIASLYDGSILRSTDKGKTWKDTIFVDNYNIGIRNFYNDKYGLAVLAILDNGTQYHYDTLILGYTSDEGKTWEKIIIAPAQNGYMNNFFKFQMVDTNLVVAVLGACDTTTCNNYRFCLWVEGTPENYKWYVDTIYFAKEYTGLTRIYFLDRYNAWTGGGRKLSDFNWTQVILKTTNGGKSWITQRDFTNEDRSPIDEIEMLNENYGMAAGGDNWVLRTYNGGNNWEMNYIDSLYYNNLSHLEVTSTTSAYVLSIDRGIYKYRAGGWTDVPEPPGNIVIYPNPASERVFIELGVWSLESGVGEIEVYNVFGEVVEEIPLAPSGLFRRNGYPNPPFTKPQRGKGEVEVDVSGLPPGMYYVVVKYSGQRFAGQFAVIR